MNIDKLNQLIALIQNDTITPAQIGQFLNMVLGVIKQSKENFEAISQENIKKINQTLDYISQERQSLLKDFRKELKASQELLKKVEAIKTIPGEPGKTPQVGVDFFVPDEARMIESIISMIRVPKDGSPDTAEQVRDKIESLKGEERLDAKAIKNLPEATKKIVTEVGGVRYLEQMSDVSIPITSKRKDALVQYDTTDNRWETGIALTVGTTQPSSPVTGDLWVDTN